jgi:AraC-like DNA-binding protein
MFSTCTFYNWIFNQDFELNITQTKQEFLSKIKNINADAIVFCFCNAEENDIDDLFHLDAFSGPIPVLVCSKDYNPNFVRLAAQGGINYFLLCDMDKSKIHQLILEAIQTNGLRKLLEEWYQPVDKHSYHAGEIINEIIHAFPGYLTISLLSQQLGISTRRLQMICKSVFGTSYTLMIRRIKIYQALKLMNSTNFDNTEIALQLNYSDENSLARIFRKELKFNPNEARKFLIHNSPEDLIIQNI